MADCKISDAGSPGQHIKMTAAGAVECPSCGLPADIVDRFTLPGSPGSIEHAKIVCVGGHWFTPPIDSLPLAGDVGFLKPCTTPTP